MAIRLKSYAGLNATVARHLLLLPSKARRDLEQPTDRAPTGAQVYARTCPRFSVAQEASVEAATSFLTVGLNIL